MNFLLFVWAFIESLMNTATNYLNKFSRDYRYVLRVLTKEKKLLKVNLSLPFSQKFINFIRDK